jgi:Ni/Co efflux regulator RcnB
MEDRMKQMFIATLIASSVALASFQCAAADSAADREMQQNMRELDRFHKQEQARKEREETRDKAHDNRLKIGPKTSVGVDYKDGTPSVNVLRK